MTQVAAGQDDTEAGMKAAAKFYNQAAGLFVFIRENIAGVLNKVHYEKTMVFPKL